MDELNVNLVNWDEIQINQEALNLINSTYPFITFSDATFVP